MFDVTENLTCEKEIGIYMVCFMPCQFVDDSSDV